MVREDVRVRSRAGSRGRRLSKKGDRKKRRRERSLFIRGRVFRGALEARLAGGGAPESARHARQSSGVLQRPADRGGASPGRDDGRRRLRRRRRASALDRLEVRRVLQRLRRRRTGRRADGRLGRDASRKRFRKRRRVRFERKRFFIATLSGRRDARRETRGGRLRLVARRRRDAFRRAARRNLGDFDGRRFRVGFVHVGSRRVLRSFLEFAPARRIRRDFLDFEIDRGEGFKPFEDGEDGGCRAVGGGERRLRRGGRRGGRRGETRGGRRVFGGEGLPRRERSERESRKGCWKLFRLCFFEIDARVFRGR